MFARETIWWKLPFDESVNALVESKEIYNAAKALVSGELVAFPTETVYGIGADATSKEAVRSIFVAKGRPQDNPLIVHIGEKEQLFQYTQNVSSAARELVEVFWPGPLTLILEHRKNIASSVTAGLSTIGIRMPNHPVALALLQVAGIPIAAPSANTSGRPSPTEASHVWEDLQERIDILLDGGPTGLGLESTIIDMTKKIPVILRPGGVTREEIERSIGPVESSFSLQNNVTTPTAPGMKYTHYAPRGQMWLVTGSQDNVISYINGQAHRMRQEGKTVGILTTVENVKHYEAELVLACGTRNDPQSIARHLYATLRKFDEHHVDVIYSETFQEEGLFVSVMNRLGKASAGNIIGV